MKGRLKVGTYVLPLKRALTIQTHNDPWNSLISIRSKTEIKENSDNGARKGPLLGTTFIVKDNIVSVGGNTTAASKMLAEYWSPFSATVVKLLDEAQLQMIGKANMDEYGMGSSNMETYFGPVINPAVGRDGYIAGGSSGGSAASVKANLADFALGTDTGGSVRLPGSYCGVIGFKPSYGRISRWGVIPYAQTLDTVGILSQSMETVVKVYNVLNQYDEKDPTSLPNDVRAKINPSSCEGGDKPLVFGLPEEFLFGELAPESKELLSNVLSSIMTMGHEVKLVSIPSIKKLLPAYYTLATAEAASNLARYDGVRYGFKSENLQSTAFEFIKSNRSSAFGDEVQRRIVLGNYTLSSESGNHYVKATGVRRDIVQEFDDVFNCPNPLFDNSATQGTHGCDIIISPTSMSPPVPIKEYDRMKSENLLNSYVNDVLTVPASLAGLPSISIPWNTKDQQDIKFPQGLQLLAQYGDDDKLLQVSSMLMTTQN